MDSNSDLPSASANPGVLQARDSIHNYIRQSFKTITERGRLRAEEMEQKRIRVEHEIKKMEARARDHMEKPELQRELSQTDHYQHDLKKKLSDSSAPYDGLGTSGLELAASSSSTLGSPISSGLMDKLSTAHAKLCGYLSSIGKIKSTDKEKKGEVAPVSRAKTPELSAKDLERENIKQRVLQYLSEIDYKANHNKPVEATKKKSIKALKKAHNFARLAAPTQSSLAKQKKKWNAKEVKEPDVRNAKNKTKASTPCTTSATPVSGSMLACSKSKIILDTKHVDGKRHSK